MTNNMPIDEPSSPAQPQQQAQGYPTIAAPAGAAPAQEETLARRFTMYRRNVPTDTHDENQRNAPDEPQFEGVQFADGTVVLRWMTAKRSTSVWDSLADMLAIHGHPEYGSELVWHDLRSPASAPAASVAVAEAARSLMAVIAPEPHAVRTEFRGRDERRLVIAAERLRAELSAILPASPATTDAGAAEKESSDEPERRIISNKVRCKRCNEVIESTYRHDFKWCGCGSVAVDGGTAYLKRSYYNEGAYEELSEFEVLPASPGGDANE